MSLFRCGGGEALPNLGGTPDAKYLNASAGTSGTASIAVTQKPRYIILSMWARTGSAYPGNFMVIDVAANSGHLFGYSGSANSDRALTSTDISGYFPTISSSSVVYNIAKWGLNHRVYIGIYY